jgi:uncharacterized protein (TIGR02444 family)
MMVARDNSHARHNDTKAHDNPLWIYALQQYKAGNCEQFLLQAQDELHLDVNLLLFIGWLAANNVKIDMQTILHSSAYCWQQDVVTPLRKIRRHAKFYAPDTFYQEILALELSAEKHQLREFHQLSFSLEHDIKSFSHALTQGCGEYFKEKERVLHSTWLQTLIEHLQPNKLD